MKHKENRSAFVIGVKELLNLCGQVGRILLTSGAETSRVETTVEYIGRASGYRLNCHATMTAILVTDEISNRVHMVKIKGNHFNLQKVDELNTLSRQYTAGKIDFETLKKAVQRIDEKVIDFNGLEKTLAAGLVSIAPMLVFKVAWLDLAWAFVVGICGYLLAHLASTKTKSLYLGPALGGLLVGFLAGLLVHLDLANQADTIVVSALMPLVPGVAITNSFREIIGKDTISGLVRAVDAVVIAGAIGGGVIMGHFLIGVIG